MEKAIPIPIPCAHGCHSLSSQTSNCDCMAASRTRNDQDPQLSSACHFRPASMYTSKRINDAAHSSLSGRSVVLPKLDPHISNVIPHASPFPVPHLFVLSPRARFSNRTRSAIDTPSVRSAARNGCMKDVAKIRLSRSLKNAIGLAEDDTSALHCFIGKGWTRGREKSGDEILLTLQPRGS